MNATSKQHVYLVDKCGSMRNIFGPFSPTSARHQAGSLYFRMVGDGFAGRTIIRRHALSTLIRIGSVKPIDGTDPTTI